MLSLNQAAIWAGIFLVFCGLVCLPICNAFQAGLASAGYPAHRVTTLSPWFFFYRAYRRELRWWKVAWLGILIACIAWRVCSLKSMRYVLHWEPPLVNAHTTSWIGKMEWAEWDSWALRTFQVFTELPAILLGFGLLFVAGCWCLTPRCKAKATLLVFSLVLPLTISALVVVEPHWRLFPYVGYMKLVGGNTIVEDLSFSLAPLVALPLCWIVYWVVILLVHEKGDRWFRFEE